MNHVWTSMMMMVLFVVVVDDDVVVAMGSSNDYNKYLDLVELGQGVFLF